MRSPVPGPPTGSPSDPSDRRAATPATPGAASNDTAPHRVPRLTAPPLGSGPRVHVRELLASALVGIEARRRVDPRHVGRVRVTSATGGGPLVVRDDGIGFTAQEVRWIAATPDQHHHGPVREGMRRYEVAILASFQVADVVELRTRSALVPGAPTMRWVGLADGTVRVTLADEALDTPGTEIRLHPRAATRSWCTPETTLEQVLDVADQLPFAVEVDGVEVSGGTTLWDRGADEQVEWFRQRVGIDPLLVLPLETSVGRVRAVAAVPAFRTTPGHRSAHRHYVGGMLVGEGRSDLVPGWASFCQVVVDDGRDILTDPAHDDAEVGERIGRALLARLILLGAEHPDLFGELVTLHGDALLRQAGESRDLLDLVRSTVPVPTTLGPRTIDALTDVVGVVPFTDDPRTWEAVRDKAAADGVLVVDATVPHVAALLDGMDRFARLRGGDLVVLGAAS
ncbi:hypothetical protein [Phycicoccus sonneratiae]|uniref:Uncharacterized protein n=1 Tax=Phycicoccus sonneratiae TaxID=2807628 RepID=A0ABS2CMX2_9MICO|nr:hypothetical protein [Phycicoccus sonneraticus]MBM6401240.1 hypothetical protein [Phycicoccus sonneraticus]